MSTSEQKKLCFSLEMQDTVHFSEKLLQDQRNLNRLLGRAQWRSTALPMDRIKAFMDGLTRFICVGILLIITIILCNAGFAFAEERCARFPALFSFGDSSFDVGSYQPFSAPTSLQRPYGSTFFLRPTGRFSDGRLPIDFLAEALGFPFLNPYSLPEMPIFDYRHGVSFATSGATVLDFPENSSSLQLQLEQFKLFKKQVWDLVTGKFGDGEPDMPSGATGYFPPVDAFANGLYMVGIGEDDFIRAHNDKQLLQKVFINATKAVITQVKDLYKVGARNFIIKDIGPQGCQPFWLNSHLEDMDSYGCSISGNNASLSYNGMLREELTNLRHKINATIIYLNTFDIIYDFYVHASEYGFNKTNMACCGVEGKYNYNPSLECGSTGLLNGQLQFADSCGHPNSSISWDGSHMTDYANWLISEHIISGRYFEPSDFNLFTPCHVKQEFGEEICGGIPAIFSFGDSCFDVGSYQQFSASTSLQFPYGSTFFFRPTGRFSDGRLLIDFIAMALGLPFLNPYSIHGNPIINYHHGVSFATASATGLDLTNISSSLKLQFQQFKLFKKHVWDLLTGQFDHGENYVAYKAAEYFPTMNAFASGLYMVGIGEDDLIHVHNDNDLVQKILPNVAKAVTRLVKELYNEGARIFIIKDMGPQGCQPFWLNSHPRDIDRYGCSISGNNASLTFNGMLRHELTKLRHKLKATIIYLNTFDIIYDFYVHPSKYGFNKTTMACCGVRKGTYHYDPSLQCGSTSLLNGQLHFASSCGQPNSFISWDGSHLTDYANRVITEHIISGRYFEPADFNLSIPCHVN